MSLNIASPGLGSTKKALGAADTAIGAGLDVANEMAFGTLRKIPYVKEKLRRYEALRPNLQKVSKIAGIGGSIATMGPLGRGVGMAAKAAFNAPKLARGIAAAGKAHPLLSNIGKGIGYGTAYNTGQQIGNDERVNLKKNIASSLPGAVGGGIAGHAAGKILRGLGPAGKFRNFQKEIGPQNVRALENKQDILTKVNPKTINKLKGDILADSSGKGRAQLERIRNRFEADQGRKLGKDITETLGKGGAPQYVSKAMRRTKPLLDKGYRDLYRKGAGTTEDRVGEAIREHPSFMKANKSVIDSHSGFDKRLYPGDFGAPESTRNLDLTKRRLQEQAGHPYMPGDLKKSNLKLSDMLTGHLTDRYDKYPNLMKLAQMRPKLGSAAQLGKDALNIPAKDIGNLEAAFTKNHHVPELSKRYLNTGLEKTAARKGTIDYLQNTLGHSKTKHGDLAWKNIANEDSSKRLATMFGEKKASDLVNRARTSSQKVDNLNTLIGGSQTAENLRAMDAKKMEGLNLAYRTAINPLRTAFGKGAQLAGKALKDTTNFSPGTKVGLMVNPRRYEKYAKKLAGQKPKHDTLASTLNRILRHPAGQKALGKTAKRMISGGGDE
jgi:hypothetical protein